MMLGSEILQKGNKYKIDYITRINLQQKALKKLNLINLNQLRDRYEGQSYLNKFLIKEYSRIGVERHLLEIKSERNISDYSIFSSSVENYPLVPIESNGECYLSFVNLSTHEVFIYGYFPLRLILSGMTTTNVSPLLQRRYFGYFTDFEVLNL